MLAAGHVAVSLADAGPAWRRMPPEERTAPPEAADHVATVMVGYRRSVERRYVVRRSGGWIRSDRTVDGRTTVHHSFLGAATSFSYVRGADGGIAAIRVARDAAASPYYRLRRAPTGGRGRALGQECRVWKTTDVGALTSSEWLSCETRDGIPLWVRETWPGSGSVLLESRATTIERRPVPANEVQPPADLFGIGVLPGGPAWTEAGPDYRIVLDSVPAAGGARDRQIIQRRGIVRSYEYRGQDGSRQLSLRNGTIAIHYEEEPGGRPLWLRVNSMPDESIPEIRGEWVPIEGRAPETILGETCRWMRSTILTSHHRRFECQTGDGLVLQIDEQNMAGHNVYRATSVSRLRLSPADFRLPAAAVDWAAWGVAR